MTVFFAFYLGCVIYVAIVAIRDIIVKSEEFDKYCIKESSLFTVTGHVPMYAKVITVIIFVLVAPITLVFWCKKK